MPNSTIYIRTYSKDLPWFKWAIASIGKFWADDSKILINCEPEDSTYVLSVADEFLKGRTVQLSPWVQWGNNKGYLFQQWAKLTADTLTDSDVIVFFDSDLLLNRVTSLDDFMDPERKRLRLFYEPYPSVEISEAGAAGWLRPTWKAMQVRPEWEFMRRHPFIFWRETIKSCREYLESLHGPLHEWLINLGSGTEQVFSEFNCLGFYAWLHQTDRYWFLNVKEYEKLAGAKYGPQYLSENPVEQFHSWTGDPEQAHGRFLQACERADYLVKVARQTQAETDKKIDSYVAKKADEKITLSVTYPPEYGFVPGVFKEGGIGLDTSEDYVAKKDQAENAPPVNDGPSPKIETDELKIREAERIRSELNQTALGSREGNGDAEPTRESESVSIVRSGETVLARVGDQLHAGIDPAAESAERSSISGDPDPYAEDLLKSGFVKQDTNENPV